MVKVLVILATDTFIGRFGYEYQWWKLCDLEFAFEKPVAFRSSTRVRGRWRQSLAPRCANRSSYSRRQVLAWD